jgi:hypothetical protein
MKTYFQTIVLVLMTPMAAAQDATGYQCALDEVTRRVEIYYETGSTVPCEVQYFRDTEMPGQREVLWRAQNEEGYCEARAAELVEKLRGMGWTCWAAGDSGPAPEAQDDDTDALAPAEEEIEISEAEAPSGN